jgi:hypothetical protein
MGYISLGLILSVFIKVLPGGANTIYVLHYAFLKTIINSTCSRVLYDPLTALLFWDG